MKSLGMKLPVHPTAGFYQQWLEKWPTEIAGRAPTLAEISAIHWSNPKRRGGLEVLWGAMCLRECGATVGQYCAATGAQGAAHNWSRTNLVEPGYVDRVKTGGGVFKFTFTDKGVKLLQAAVAAVAKPAKARKADAEAKAGKARKARAKADAVAVAAEATADALPAAEAEAQAAEAEAQRAADAVAA